MTCPDGYFCSYTQIPTWLGIGLLLTLVLLGIFMLLVFWLDSRR